MVKIIILENLHTKCICLTKFIIIIIHLAAGLFGVECLVYFILVNVCSLVISSMHALQGVVVCDSIL